LSELTFRHLDLPRSGNACAAEHTLDYNKVQVNGATLLLPAMAQMVIINRDRTKSVNQTTFSACHEFVGQSEVHFGNKTEKTAPSLPVPAGLGVTGDLPFEIAIMQDIDTRTAAAGDPIRCELATPIRDGEKVVAPAGTPVAARILQLTRHYGFRNSVTLAFRLESILFGGSARTLSAHPRPSTAEKEPESGKATWSSAGEELTAVLGLKGYMLMTNGLRTLWITGK
jgi:hypothetical protein